MAAYQQQRLTPTGAQLAAAASAPAGAPGAGGGAMDSSQEDAGGAEVSDAELADAIAWARRHCGGVSLRAAAMYARFFAGGRGGAPAAA